MADDPQAGSESTAAAQADVRDDAPTAAASETVETTAQVAAETPAPKDYGKLLSDLSDMSDAEYDRYLKDNPSHPGNKVANARASRHIEQARRDAAQKALAQYQAEQAKQQTEQQRLLERQQREERVRKLRENDYETQSQVAQEILAQEEMQLVLDRPEVVEQLIARPEFQERLKAHPELGSLVGREAMGRVNQEIATIRAHPAFGGELGVDTVNAIWSGSQSFADMVDKLHQAKVAKAIAAGDLIPKTDFTKRVAAAQAQARSDALGGLPDRDTTPSAGSFANGGPITPDVVARMSPREFKARENEIWAQLARSS